MDVEYMLVIHLVLKTASICVIYWVYVRAVRWPELQQNEFYCGLAQICNGDMSIVRGIIYVPIFEMRCTTDAAVAVTATTTTDFEVPCRARVLYNRPSPFSGWMV